MRRTIQNYLENYGKSYIFLFVFLILGVIAGVIGVNNSNSNVKQEITEYLTNTICSADKNNISYINLLKNSILTKTQFIFIVLFLSLSVIGKYGAIAIVTFKGFTLGYSIASAISTFGIGRGLIMSISLILLTEIIYIPTIFYTIITSLTMFNDCYSQNYESKSKFILKYIIKLLCIFATIIIISLIETFLNVNIFLLFGKMFVEKN